MAAPKTRSANLPRPKRTLVLFLAAIVAMYGLVALLDVNAKKGDDSAWKPKLGLDLQGGTRITFEAKAESGKVTADKLSQARDIIDQRVNGTGVTEAEVTTQGGNQIIVEIPGQQRADIVDQVGKTAQLRFRLVWGTGSVRHCTGRHDRRPEDRRRPRLVQALAGPADQGRDRRGRDRCPRSSRRASPRCRRSWPDSSAIPATSRSTTSPTSRS